MLIVEQVGDDPSNQQEMNITLNTKHFLFVFCYYLLD